MQKNHGKLSTCPIFNIFIHLKDIRHRMLKSSIVVQNFFMLLAPKYFWGAPQISGRVLSKKIYFRSQRKILRWLVDGAQRYIGKI